jgi:hypothetical protein
VIPNSFLRGVLGNEKKAYLVYDMNMNEDFRPFKMICEDTIKLDKKNNKNIFLG